MSDVEDPPGEEGARTTLAVAAWSSAAAVFCLLVSGAFLHATNARAINPYWLGHTVVALTCGAVGGLIAARRPGHRIGWIYLAAGACLALAAFSSEYLGASLERAPGRSRSPASSRRRGPRPGRQGWHWSPASRCCCIPTGGCRRGGGGRWPGPPQGARRP